jgi:hypothetical protein
LCRFKKIVRFSNYKKKITKNLKVLLAQQKNQIEEAISRAQTEYIQRLAADNGVTLSELDGILQPIIDNCTKDSISHGKY